MQRRLVDARVVVLDVVARLSDPVYTRPICFDAERFKPLFDLLNAYRPSAVADQQHRSVARRTGLNLALFRRSIPKAQEHIPAVKRPITDG